VSTDIAKATHHAPRAAERALEQLVPGEAVRWYRQALELHDHAPGGERSERCELLIGLGEAQRHGQALRRLAASRDTSGSAPDGHAVYRAAAALALIESGRTDEVT